MIGRQNYYTFQQYHFSGCSRNFLANIIIQQIFVWCLVISRFYESHKDKKLISIFKKKIIPSLKEYGYAHYIIEVGIKEIQTLVQKEKVLQEEICTNYSGALKGQAITTCVENRGDSSRGKKAWVIREIHVGWRQRGQDILAEAVDVTSHKGVNRDGNCSIIQFIWYVLMMHKFGDKQGMSQRDCVWPVWILVWRRWGIIMQERNVFTWNFNKITTASKVGGGSRDNKWIVKLPWKLIFRDHLVLILFRNYFYQPMLVFLEQVPQAGMMEFN